MLRVTEITDCDRWIDKPRNIGSGQCQVSGPSETS